MDTLKFSSDPNNILKLDCFPALRLDSGKYVKDQQYMIVKGARKIGVAVCVRFQNIQLKHITDSLSYTLCGKEAPYLKQVLRNMYPATDWSSATLSYMHFRFLEREDEPDPASATAGKRAGLAVQGTLSISCRSYQNGVY